MLIITISIVHALYPASANRRLPLLAPAANQREQTRRWRITKRELSTFPDRDDNLPVAG